MHGIGNLAVLLGALAVAAAALYAVVQALRNSFHWGGVRVVRCPETLQNVAVRVDAAHAASTGLIDAPELRLSSCTRWPEKAGCGQECLSQIEMAPEGCLVRNIAIHWYQGKKCVYCGRPLGEFHWPDFRCALRLQNGKTLEWRDLAPEKLPTTLDQALPVCWNCHLAETFRREHPDLVTDRPGDVVGALGERSGSPRVANRN